MAVKYDFDTVRPRTGMGASKWEGAQAKGCPPDVVPLTVADMEFMTAPEIVEAVQRLAAFGMWGYTGPTAEYKQASRAWMQTRHGWDAKPEWMANTPGVVPALFVAVRAFTRPGDGVLVQTPVYHPFFYATQRNGRTLVENPLRRVGTGYEMDFDDLEQKAKQARLMLFCSPHNPVGRVWRPDEVARVAEICARNDVLLFSDEIHCDILMPGHSHHSVGRLAPQLVQNAVIGTSACKTFSLAGVPCSNIYIPDEGKRQAFVQQQGIDALSASDAFGYVATQAGYEKGGPWLEAMLEYIHGNYRWLKDFVAESLPGVRLMDMEGTYLAWLDFSAFGLEDEALDAFLKEEAALYMNPGVMFGTGGQGFMRANLAGPRAAIQAPFHRLAEAAKKRGLAQQ